MHAQCNICSFTALDEQQWNEHTSSTRHKLNDFIYYEGVKAGQYQADAKLRQALTEANELYNAVEAMNLELIERIAQDELAFGFMREANTLLTADVTRLTAELAQCKHALDDEGDKITFAQFVSATGRHPTQDDMDRVNYANVGEIGHHNCGWCRICNKPRFEVSCGHEAVMIVATKQAEQ